MDTYEGAVWVSFGLGLAAQAPTALYPIGQQRCFQIPRTLVFEVPKNIVWFLGWRPKHAYLCTLKGQQRCFWMPRMLVFDLNNAKKYSLGSGVTPQTPIPLYHIGHQRCFRIPTMGVFELHNAKKHGLGSGVGPQTHLPLYPTGQ